MSKLLLHDFLSTHFMEEIIKEVPYVKDILYKALNCVHVKAKNEYFMLVYDTTMCHNTSRSDRMRRLFAYEGVD